LLYSKFAQNLRFFIGLASWTIFLGCCISYTNNLRVHASTAEIIGILNGFLSAMPLCSTLLWEGGVKTS
jgi:hypothetical protein